VTSSRGPVGPALELIQPDHPDDLGRVTHVDHRHKLALEQATEWPLALARHTCIELVRAFRSPVRVGRRIRHGLAQRQQPGLAFTPVKSRNANSHARAATQARANHQRHEPLLSDTGNVLCGESDLLPAAVDRFGPHSHLSQDGRYLTRLSRLSRLPKKARPSALCEGRAATGGRDNGRCGRSSWTNENDGTK
jgi:hypothetical protein